MILLRIFKDNRMVGVAGLIAFSLALFIFSYIHGDHSAGVSGVEGLSAMGAVDGVGSMGGVGHDSGMPFYKLLFGSIHQIPVLDHMIALLALMLIGYMLIRIGVRNVLLKYRSLMPAIFFLLFTAALPSTHHVSPALIGSIFYLLCFAILFEVHDKPPDTYSIFTASFVLIVGSMFYLKLIWFVPLIWVSLLTIRQVNWRELFYPVTAYILLGLFLVTWYWGVMDDMAGFTKLIGENLAFNGAFTPLHFSAYIYYGFLLFLVLLASVYMINRFQTRKTVTQNIYQVMFFMFLAGIMFFVFITRFDPSTLVYISLPVSYILANYFHRKKNHWLHELALWIVVGLLVFVQLMV